MTRARVPRRTAVLRRLITGAVLVGAASLAVPQSSAPSSDATAAAAVARDRCGRVVAKANGRPWRCTFVDRFRGHSLDRSRWITQHTADTGFRTERTCYQDSPANVALRNGRLVLTARKGRWVNCRFHGRWLRTRFTGGMVGTRGRFSQTYGRFEVRARFPDTDRAGLHGGFWMFPVHRAYGRWPASGEIDVAEWWSYDPTLVLPSLHFNGRDPDVDSGWECRVADPADFHVYTTVWRPSTIRFYIDGTQCFARRWTPDRPQVRPQPFDKPFSLILTMGVSTSGLSWRTEFPAELVVDYAKAWR